MDYKDTVKIMLNQGLILINRKLKIVKWYAEEKSKLDLIFTFDITFSNFL